ncbi:reverse transcriptase domain, reverse transcriptase zinc-binding domain protein, partial [Tanacetum coccineum]
MDIIEMSPSSSVRSGWDRLKTKMKCSQELVFVGVEVEKNFNQALMDRWQGAWCLFWDLNVVRGSDDRFNSQVNVKETNEFNEFINDIRLVEVPMGVRRFTRVSDNRLKFSKLDRFLLNDDFNSLWGNLSVVALDQKLSNHCPIVLKDAELDFGPKPFRVFNMWMEESDFIQVIEEAWKKDVRSFWPDCKFRDRLKNVKASLRWEMEAKNRMLTDIEREAWLQVVDLIGLGDYRPISLIGCYYKVISKMLAERVKHVVGNVVAEEQNAFIRGRYILDGVLIANKSMQFLKKKKEKENGLGEEWCKWVEVCHKSSSMSILVNGLPSKEFGLERGVRQGDPLSPFLFTLAVEGLNAIMNKAVSNGIFRGVKVGRNNVMVSHLQYADDTTLFGEWNKENAKSLMCILKCLEEVSGLRVNYNKSKLYRIGVNEIELADMVRSMGCGIGEFPFMYLGLSIRENMRRTNAWTPVGEEIDGLGVEFSSSFVGVLRDGRDIRFWIDRWVGNRRLSDAFPRLFHLDRGREGSVMEKGAWVDGMWRWEWDWVREIKGRVCKEFDDLMEVLQNVIVSNCRDGWRWVLVEDGEFKVKELTRLVEKKILHVESGRLPVRVKLDRRGIELDSVLCPSCNNVVESCAHSLVTCDLSMSVWEKIFRWWKMGTVNALSIDEFFSSLGNVNVPVAFSRVWQAVIWTTGYHNWKEKNARVFGNKISSTNKTVQDVQIKSFEWIVRRSNKFKDVDGQQWMYDPIKYRLQ